MNGYREDASFCYFHPKEVVIGVCPLCLNERLLVLAAKQGHLPSSRGGGSHRSTHHHYGYVDTNTSSRKRPINIPKIFALGSLLNRLEFRHWRSDNSDDDDRDDDQEDSFISIKFEDNGVPLWEKGTAAAVSKISLEQCKDKSWMNNNDHNNKDMSKEAKQQRQQQQQLPYNNKDRSSGSQDTKSVVEHSKPRASLRWRKRIGHLFQLMRQWKRSNSNGTGGVCHVGTKVEGVKVRNKGWIRTLTKSKTKD